MKTYKTVIINRAVPGSGKTTISNCILGSLNSHHLSIALHSTDEYFMNAGKYDFDITKLYDYHQKNLKEFTKSLSLNIDIVICDNTNLAPWQTKPYTDIARKYGYKILFISFEPRELEKHVASQIVTVEKPDAHGVSEEVIISMIEEYRTYNNLLNSQSKVNLLEQFDYKWNVEEAKKELTKNPSSHFDLDNVIKVLPSEYHEMQLSIGDRILNIIALKSESSLDE